MIKIKDKVMVHPNHTMKFLNEWGTVVQVKPNDNLCLGLTFGSSQIYWFDTDEVLTEEEVKRFKDEIVKCSVCGKDLTGQFISVCEECAFPLPKE
jgi:translation initiation factor 2 beta subunit (eIF-2beta)/eIF-5